MKNWFKQLTEPKPRAIHPPWEVGQYVSYFFEGDDGDWLAFMLRIMGSNDEGVWAICADFKSQAGETTTWLRCDLAASDLHRYFPARMETIRTSPGATASDYSKALEDPGAHATFAMNLLLVRDWPQAAIALEGMPRDVDYACGIKQAFPLDSTVPGLDEQYDLNPRVMLTGVACLSVDEGKNPIVVTSFGSNNIDAPLVSVYEDFVDFSHMTEVEHEGFALTYPATWFLRLDENLAIPASRQGYVAPVGGNTCAAMMSVRVYSGMRDYLEEEREKFIKRARTGVEPPLQRLVARKEAVLTLERGGQSYVLDLQIPKIDGFERSALYDSGDRLAELTLFGCVAQQNPRRRETLDEMERVFLEIAQSFRLT